MSESPCSEGSAADGFEPVRQLFDEYLRSDDGYGAQLSVRLHGQPVVDLAGGGLATDSVTGIYSVTKAVAATVVARLIDAGDIDLDARVTEYWPEFGAAGKQDVLVREALSHQAGLPAVRGGTTVDELLVDSSRAASRLAEQAPAWRPGTAFGYHATTIGTLMEELVRRRRGETLQELFEREIRARRGLDVFLGLPESEDHRYVPLAEPVLDERQRDELSTRPPDDAVREWVFGHVDAPPGYGVDGTTTNNVRVRRAGQAATGGVASAAGLAALFADALPDSADPVASASTLAMMAQQNSWGIDRVLNSTNAFGIVFLLPQPRLPYASIGAFGHDGAGGALAFADPVSGLSFGYVPSPDQYPGGADHRSVALARLSRECARRA